MAKTFACKDVGIECPYVGRGETEEELMTDISKHVKVIHGYTDEQLNDPGMMKRVRAAIKEG